MRIVSLLPSATEVICGIGLRDQLVGVTHECDYPTDVADLPKVTKTLIPTDASSREIDDLVRERLKTKAALYSLDIEVLERLQPDLIVTQALCDVCAVAEDEVRDAACSLPSSPRVINLEPTCLDDVMQCIRLVGEASGCEAEGAAYVDSLQQRIAAVARRSESIQSRPSVMMLEWIDPPFNAGHWSPELVAIAGGREAIGVAGQRSVTTPWQTIVDADPEVIVIACCGFSVARTLEDIPILRSYPGWDSLACVQADRVSIVDGSAYFSRPGPRLVDSLEILAHTLHPHVHPLPDGLSAATRVKSTL
ncbi:iron complex transport system substrate-binding protein [Rhodopirellula rubra]|uniref:Iron complex transport system substrate-binding protein n=1 Tax=Aporhodopirellula rubra TaxID=980271 RepID=A0A7W5H747_9BACT|nr:cobalamin-binding protein [Aporhodopirellula rubra]MBB3207625.1 iron complex transport system substrate-binding protein [Aporhodopirellula rubra]